MKESEFRRLMSEVRMLGPSDYLDGYQRGLRRVYHGEPFGTADEHTHWMALVDRPDPMGWQRGAGYRDGLEGLPPDDASRLRREIERIGTSQRGLARTLAIDERTVRKYCAGDLEVPQLVWLAVRSIPRGAHQP